jgi:hypothetical protein
VRTRGFPLFVVKKGTYLRVMTACEGRPKTCIHTVQPLFSYHSIRWL